MLISSFSLYDKFLIPPVNISTMPAHGLISSPLPAVQASAWVTLGISIIYPILEPLVLQTLVDQVNLEDIVLTIRIDIVPNLIGYSCSLLWEARKQVLLVITGMKARQVYMCENDHP
jgi:hypothetical protein